MTTNQTWNMTMKNMKLTRNHATSSYGIPVLVDETGTAYGPVDLLPNGMSGRDFIAAVRRGAYPLDLSDLEEFDPVDLLGEWATRAENLFLDQFSRYGPYAPCPHCGSTIHFPGCCAQDGHGG